MASETLTDFLSPKEAARALGISACRVRQLCAAGRLPYVRTSLGRLIDRGELKRFEEKRTEKRKAR